MNNIKQIVREGKTRWTNRVIGRLFQRNISQEDIKNVPSQVCKQCGEVSYSNNEC